MMMPMIILISLVFTPSFVSLFVGKSRDDLNKDVKIAVDDSFEGILCRTHFIINLDEREETLTVTWQSGSSEWKCLAKWLRREASFGIWISIKRTAKTIMPNALGRLSSDDNQDSLILELFLAYFCKEDSLPFRGMLFSETHDLPTSLVSAFSSSSLLDSWDATLFEWTLQWDDMMSPCNSKKRNEGLCFFKRKSVPKTTWRGWNILRKDDIEGDVEIKRANVFSCLSIPIHQTIFFPSLSLPLSL